MTHWKLSGVIASCGLELPEVSLWFSLTALMAAAFAQPSLVRLHCCVCV